MERIICLIAALVTLSATAMPTVEIKKVAQRWPWNNKLDITYEVTGGQDVSQNIFRRLVFTAVIDGVTNVIDGVHDLGANASNGVHTVTWTAPSGHRTDNCTMSAALYPSDTDYYYFVAASSSRSLFASTKEEHEENIRRIMSGKAEEETSAQDIG